MAADKLITRDQGPGAKRQYRSVKIPSPGGPATSETRRVEMWRGGGRSNISVAAPFVWRCLTGSAVAPFPHPAHRTGQAELPHPALGQDVTRHRHDRRGASFCTKTTEYRRISLRRLARAIGVGLAGHEAGDSRPRRAAIRLGRPPSCNRPQVTGTICVLDMK